MTEADLADLVLNDEDWDLLSEPSEDGDLYPDLLPEDAPDTNLLEKSHRLKMEVLHDEASNALKTRQVGGYASKWRFCRTRPAMHSRHGRQEDTVV